MQVTEQNKQEAEKVVEMYRGNHFIKPQFWGQQNIQSLYIQSSAIQCAIQDRQSVLEALKYSHKLSNPSESVWHHLKREITNLTEQIEYLKSKL